MTTLIISCLVVSLGGGPSQDRIGFHYWQTPGAFAEYILEGPKGKFLGWWAAVVQACFAFVVSVRLRTLFQCSLTKIQGTEVVGITFGETPNPRRNIPRAVKQTFWRISCFYILGVLVLGMSVPYNSPKLIGATQKSTSGGTFCVHLHVCADPNSRLAFCSRHVTLWGQIFPRYYQRLPPGIHTKRCKLWYVLRHCRDKTDDIDGSLQIYTVHLDHYTVLHGTAKPQRYLPEPGRTETHCSPWLSRAYLLLSVT